MRTRRIALALLLTLFFTLSLTACNRADRRPNWTPPAESSSAPAAESADLADDFDDLDALFDELDQILSETNTEVEVPE